MRLTAINSEILALRTGEHELTDCTLFGIAMMCTIESFRWLVFVVDDREVYPWLRLCMVGGPYALLVQRGEHEVHRNLHVSPLSSQS